MAKFVHIIFTFVFALSLIDDTVSQLPPIIDISIDNNTNPNDVGFYLCANSTNVTDCDELVYLNPASINNSRYNRDNPVILLTHGFTQTNLSQFPYYVKKAYLDAGYATKANIIVVDWGKLSGGNYNVSGILNISVLAQLPAYLHTVGNVKVVGKRVQEFLVFLIDNGFLSGPDKIHLVGQSLGAHVSGMAGYYFNQVTSTKIARITGTDPAGPVFQAYLYFPNERLDKTDAKFVDIVHTNGGEMGYLGNLGHVDFYVNSIIPLPPLNEVQLVQPPCKNLVNATDLFCSHNLAPRYFAKSIPLNFNTQAACTSLLSLLGFDSCNTYSTTFGEHCPTTARGSFEINLTLGPNE